MANPTPHQHESALTRDATALSAAQALAQAIAESAPFREFEAANDALHRDVIAFAKLRSFERRQQELRVAAMWGGAGPDEQAALEREWQTLSQQAAIRSYLLAFAAVRDLFREIAGRITGAIGVDYGATCSPGGACCQ